MMSSTKVGATAISVRLTPLLEAHWSYAEFTKLMPFGSDAEGQAFAVSNDSHVDGERLSGSYRMVQYPRWRADGIYLANAHGLIGTSNRQVITRAAGYVIPAPDATDRWSITHWMRFWASAPELRWLNETVAVGFGSMVGGKAMVSYFGAAPTTADSQSPDGAPKLNLLGTAHWEYPVYEAVRTFGDDEGVGFGASIGSVDGGPLEGAWRGWHYPTYLRNGLYQIDAHAAIDGRQGD